MARGFDFDWECHCGHAHAHGGAGGDCACVRVCVCACVCIARDAILTLRHQRDHPPQLAIPTTPSSTPPSTADGVVVTLCWAGFLRKIVLPETLLETAWRRLGGRAVVCASETAGACRRSAPVTIPAHSLTALTECVTSEQRPERAKPRLHWPSCSPTRPVRRGLGLAGRPPANSPTGSPPRRPRHLRKSAHFRNAGTAEGVYSVKQWHRSKHRLGHLSSLPCFSRRVSPRVFF